MATEERKVQIVVEADATRAKEGFAEVKQGAHDMARSVGQAGDQAGKGLDSLGGAGDKAATKLDRAAKSIVNSIQRTTAVLESGGAATTGFYESIARQRGVSVDALRPYLDQLDLATAKQRAAATGVVDMTLSAGQLKNALRGVPAQFTDIATSLVSGQAPLTVLLQQGGQLKDMFGGAGAAARAMGGYVVGLINPFTLLAATAGTVGTAYYQGSKEADALAKSIILTGNAAGTSVGQLNEMAKAVASATGATQGASANALEQAVSTGKVAAGNLQLVAEAAVRMERSTGTSLDETIKKFTDLGKEPVKASERLNDATNYLTAELYKQIKALEDQGRMLEAGALAQKAFADSSISAAKQIENNYGGVEILFYGIRDAALSMASAVAGIGRTDDFERIAELRQKMAPGRGIFAGISSDEQQELAMLEARVEKGKQEAAVKAEITRQEQARIAWMKEGDKYLSKSEERERAIIKARNEGLAAGLSEVEITKRIADIREKMADPKQRKPGKSQEQKDAEELDKILDRINGKSSGLDAGYYKDLQALFKAYKGGKLDLEDYQGAVEKLTGIQKFHTDALTAEKKAQEEARKAQDAYFDTWQKYLTGLDQEAAKLEDQVATYGLGKHALASLTLARAEDTLQKARDNGVSDEYLAKLEQEVELRKRIASATASQDAQEANAKAAEKAAQDWQRVSDDVGRSLTEAIFAGGKDGMELFKATIKATIIRVAVQPVVTQGVQGIMQSVMGSLGGSGGSAGGSSLGGIGNLFSAGSSLAGMGGGLSAFTGASGYLQFGSMASSFATGLSAAAGGADLTAAIAAYEAAGMGATAGALGAGAATAGTVGAGAAGAMGAAMSGLMTAAPYLAVALLVADQLGAFKGATYHKGGAYLADTAGATAQATNANFKDFNLGWGAYGVDRVSAYDDTTKAISMGLATQLAASVAAYGGTSQKLTVGTRFASDNDDWSEGAIRIVNQAGEKVYDFTKRYTKDANKALEEFSADTTRAYIAALAATDLADQFDALFDSVDPLKASIENLNTVLKTAGQVSEALSYANGDALSAARAAAKSATEQYYGMGDALRASAQDGALSMESIVASLKDRYTAEVSMLTNLDSVSRSVSGTIEESIRNMKYGLLDTAGQYAMLDQEAARYMDTLRGLTDPTLIADYAGKLNDTLNSAYQLIPTGLKADEAQAFIDRFTQIDTLTQSRVSASRDQVLADQQQLSVVIGDAITATFAKVQTGMDSAATALDAVTKVIPETITLRLQSGGSGSEVGYELNNAG